MIPRMKNALDEDVDDSHRVIGILRYHARLVRAAVPV